MKVYQLVLDNCGDGVFYDDVYICREMAEAALKKKTERFDIDIEFCRIKEITVKTK